MHAEGNSLRSNSKKGLAGLLAAFFLIQIAIDLGRSVTAFPFVHYGMFSESFPKADSLLVYELTLDGRRTEPQDYRIYRWDMIQQPLAAFDRLTATHDFAEDRRRIKLALSGFYSLNLGNSPDVATRFPDWYRDYLSRLLGHPIHSLEIDRAWYRYTGNQFILQRKTPWIVRQW